MAANDPAYRFESVDGCCIVTLNPSLNDVQWSNIERIGSDVLAQLAPLRSPRLLADLSGLNYMGSAMVALVVRLWKAVNERNGTMVVVNHNEMVLEVLKLAGLANVWTIVPTREEGLAALGTARRSAGESSGGSVALALLGFLAAALSVAAVAATHWKLGVSIPAETLRYIALGGAGVGLLFGLVSAIRSAGFPRVVGVVSMLLSLSGGAVVAGLIALPAAAPAKAGQPGSNENDKMSDAAPSSPKKPVPKDAANPADPGEK